MLTQTMLTLTMLRCPDRVAPQSQTLQGGECSIGRGPDNDWVLPDPGRHLSKRHCLLAYRAGGWHVQDTSANGTFVNHDQDPIGQGGRRLRDRDRLRLGPYEIEVRIIEQRPVDPSPMSFVTDANKAALNPFAENFELRQGPGLLPADFNPLLSDVDPGFVGPPQSDHGPSFTDAFQHLQSSSLPPEQKLIPDDWDLDLVPRVQQRTEPPRTEPPRTEPPRTEPPRTEAPLGENMDLLSAFLDGAGIERAAPADREATMRALGRTFRALVSGLRQAIMARAEVKAEFRIEQTMIRARGNNPLKFSADDDDALAALLGIGRVTDVDPARAVAEALRDMRLHELAAMAAMQAGVRALLTQFAPDRLRAEADEAGGLTLMPAQRRARAWDNFEKLYARTSRALDDDFDSVFGRSFARAYEQTMRELGGDPEG